MQKENARHLEDVRGQYLVEGEWKVVRDSQLVHSAPTTASKPEFLLGFIDFSSISTSASGMYAETLQVPLQMKRNVYQSTVKISTIVEIAGFSTVDAREEAGLLARPHEAHPLQDRNAKRPRHL